jgi:hypothetical protein
MNFFRKKINKQQCCDTGMAMVLLVLIAHAYTKRAKLVPFAMALLVLDMIAPKAFRPVAVVWLGLSDVLGRVMSTVVMTVVFFFFVTPIGIVRKALGRDSLKLRGFKASDGSVMLQRNHMFVRGDLETPY